MQVAFGDRRASRLTSRSPGITQSRASLPGESLVEFRLADGEGADLEPGAELKVDMFTAGQIVDVAGTTIGKGYAGIIKRHNFAGGPAAPRRSVSHRAPGSIGQRQTPGRVFPGKRMSGHMGNMQPHHREPRRSSQVDAERNLLLVRGAVPGAPGGRVIVRPSVKAAVAPRARPWRRGSDPWPR